MPRSSNLRKPRHRLDVTDAALSELATEGYDPVYGARPLKRAVQQHLMNALAKALLAGTISDGDTVAFDYKNGSFGVSATTSAELTRRSE